MLQQTNRRLSLNKLMHTRNLTVKSARAAWLILKPCARRAHQPRQSHHTPSSKDRKQQFFLGFDRHQVQRTRNAIEQWMNSLNSHQSNKSAITTAGQSGNLSGEMAIQHFDRAGNAISGAKWSFTNVYPVALGEIALDWGSNDTIEEFTIDFAYDYWTHGQNTPNL